MVDPILFNQPQQAGRDIVFIGRLEFGGKRLDMRLDAWRGSSTGWRVNS